LTCTSRTRRPVHATGRHAAGAELREQVLEARTRQSNRFGLRGGQVNGRMTPRQVRKFCALKPEALAINAAMEDLGLSEQAHDKALCGPHDR